MLKLLIVDDENLIRKGLIKVLARCNTDCQVIGEAANGLEALEFIRSNRPDVIVTDVKMPKMDGIELIKNIEINYPEIKKIVLSGFDEFNYVRDSMRRGAMDYLLKPVDEVQLFAVLRKIEKDIATENEHKTKELNIKVQLNESMPLLKEQFIRELVCEKKYSVAMINNRMECYNIHILPGTFYILVIHIDNYGMIYERHGAEEARLKSFIIKNIAEETVGNLVNYISCSINHELVIALSIPTENPNKLKEVVDLVFYNLNTYSGVRFTAGLGTVVDSLDKLNESYKAACHALKHRFYSEGSSLLTPETIKKKSPFSTSYEQVAPAFQQFENKLKSCVELANSEQVRTSISEFCNSLYHYRYEPRDTIKLLGDIYMKMQMSYPEFGRSVNEIQGYEYSYVKALELFDTLDEIKKYTIELYGSVVRHIGEIRKRKDKKLVEVVKDYVIKHYNEDITLNKIAEIVYMNPSYICDLFKNQTGEQFVVFLTRIRIDKAKALLKDVRIKTYEVGQMVGYEDPTYFSKVFKKVVGISPSEYRSLVE